MRISTFVLSASIALATLAGPALAGSPDTPLPDWDQLTAQQREALVAPMRARWNSEPEKRARMLRHAERWQQMTPEEREHARHGMKRWRHMSPERREEARALYQRMRDMPAKERKALRERWEDMSPEQRREWLEQNPAGD